MRISDSKNTGIQPGEKLRIYGSDRLSDNELLSIIIGSENSGLSTHQLNELTSTLISHFGTLTRLAQSSVTELAQIKGLGYARASRIKAAMELGKRPLVLKNPGKIEFSSPGIIYDFYSPLFAGLNREVFYAILLDRGLNWISEIKISDGTLFSCQVNPKETFSKIIRENPAAVVFLHNHPSGDPEPSFHDGELTCSLCDIGEFLQIQVIDHIIIGQGCYYSFAEKGRLGSNKQQTENQALVQDESTNELEIMPDICCMHDFPLNIGGFHLDE